MIDQQKIIQSLPHVLQTIDIPKLGTKTQGKVRDIYSYKGQRITITTDRQSAFDVILGCIPYKGAVLNQLAAFWFEKTRDIIQNHMIATPDPNVLISKECQGIPVEMVVRGYMSGVTKTSIWYSYEKGERIIYGVQFPDGMKKNDKLPHPVITPTTHGGPPTSTKSSRLASYMIDTMLTEHRLPKAGELKGVQEAQTVVHDERLTREQILKRGLVSEKLYTQMEDVALALFDFGSKFCLDHGLILVDTKYEFGLFENKLILMDEIHTPDSSRFWIANTYRERIQNEQEPDNFDKEFLRLWYAERGYRGDGTPPPMSQDLIVKLAERYIAVYEKITEKTFEAFEYPIEERIEKNIFEYLKL